MDYIQLAVDKTKEGIEQNIGGPFGATIVRGDEIIAVVGNTMMRDTDITAHAEIVAIREASKSLVRWIYQIVLSTLLANHVQCVWALSFGLVLKKFIIVIQQKMLMYMASLICIYVIT